MDRHTVIGGGAILEAAREKYRTVKAAQVLSYLHALEQGDVRGVVQRYLARNLFHPVLPGELSRETALKPEKIQVEIMAAVSRGEFFEIAGKGFFARERLDFLKQRTGTIVKEFFAQNPLAACMKPLEIKGRLSASLDDVLLQRILDELLTEGRIIQSGSGYRLPDFRVKLLPEQEKLAALLLRYARESGLVPFGAGKFCKFNTRLRTFSQPEIQKILDHLRDEGRLIKLNDNRYLTPAALEEIKAKVSAVISERGVFVVEDLKKALGYGRTRGIPVLEVLDEIGFTVRLEQGRILRSPEPEWRESAERLPQPQKAPELEHVDRA
jgi:selenocysteine-specific elongation factor